MLKPNTKNQNEKKVKKELNLFNKERPLTIKNMSNLDILKV